MAGPQAHGFMPDDDTPVYVISVAAELSGMHAQTLRQYDRLGIVTPERTRGGGRRYSPREVVQLREVQRLSQEGVSLAGITRILQLENQVAALRARVSELSEELERIRSPLLRDERVFAAGLGGEVVALPAQLPSRSRTVSRALMLWQHPFLR